MTWMERLRARLNERSTWATVYAALVATAPQALGLEAPWNIIVLLMAFLGALIPDGKVVKGAEA